MLAGQEIGRYHIIEQLGQGGMAMVYKAFDTRLEREVAIKVIRMENFGTAMAEQMLKRFEREGKSLAKMMHPNIVPIHDYGEYEGSPYLVMAYIPGGTLKTQTGKMIPYPQAARLLSPIAHALAYAHNQNVIHRDVKPANILITSSGQPMLSDFGVAKILEGGDSNTLTGTGVGIGTPEYMAPEQWMNKVVPQTDIYALGVVFYELVTGRKPYSADTPAAVLIKQINDPLPRPQQYVPDLPEQVEGVLYKALARNPEERYASMSDFAEALEKLAAQAKTQQTWNTPTGEEVTLLAEDAGQTGKPTPRITAEETLGTPQPAQIPKRRQPAGAGMGAVPAWGYILAGVALVGLITGALVMGINIAGNNAAALTAAGAIPANQTSPAPAVSEPVIPTNGLPTPTEGPPTANVGVGSSWLSPVDRMPLVYVPEGNFTMGSDNGNDDEKPVHTVWQDAYWVDKYEVSNARFENFVKQTGYLTTAEKAGKSNLININNQKWDLLDNADWKHPQGAESSINGLENHPVVQVSQVDAAAYCKWAGRRLPTEAEWEKAARGTDGRIFPWGNNKSSAGQVNFDPVNFADKNLPAAWADMTINDGAMRTSAVGHFPGGASPYDALDMAGNVWEWTQDWYSNAYYDNSPDRNPRGPETGENRVVRGGSYFDTEWTTRTTQRDRPYPPDWSCDLIGFRCVADSMK